MDLFGAVNFLELQNSKDADRAARKLDDLKDEYNYIMHNENYDRGLKSWHEFKRNITQKKPNYLQNTIVGAGIGAAVLGGLSFLLLPVVAAPAALAYVGSGALLGGILGGYHETENSQRNAQVKAYDKYLNSFRRDHAQPNIPLLNQELNTTTDYIWPRDYGVKGKGGTPSPTVAPELIAANAAPEKEHGCGCRH